MYYLVEVPEEREWVCTCKPRVVVRPNTWKNLFVKVKDQPYNRQEEKTTIIDRYFILV